MIFNTDTGGAFDVFKPTLIPIPLAVNLSLQFRFTEFPDAVPDPSIFYNVSVVNSGAFITCGVFLTSDGSLFVEAPDLAVPGDVNVFVGVWLPSSGGTRTVHFTVDGTGTPLLFIDGVPIPLAFSSSFTPFPSTYSDAVSVNPSRGGVGISTASMDFIMVNSGVQPPTTVYCCPDGSPAS